MRVRNKIRQSFSSGVWDHRASVITAIAGEALFPANTIHRPGKTVHLA